MEQQQYQCSNRKHHGLCKKHWSRQHINTVTTNAGGCLATRTVTVNACRESGQATTIAETATEDNIQLYPNPNKGQFTLSGSLATITDGEVTIEVVNMLGQVIYKNNAAVQNGSINRQIELQGNLASRMYMLNLKTDNCKKQFRFVVGK